MDPSLNIALEFGVYEGGTSQLIRTYVDPSCKVFGFDTFTGLPTDWVGTTLTKGFFNRDGVVPNIQGVKFYKGLFSETIPQYLQDEENNKQIGLIHIDCDLYSSTIDVLFGLNHLIGRNTILAFDEWIYNFNPNCNDHEQKAFYEWVEQTNRTFEFLPTCESPLEIEQKVVRILS